jgi:hypothetical protein
VVTGRWAGFTNDIQSTPVRRTEEKLFSEVVLERREGSAHLCRRRKSGVLVAEV